MSKWTPEPWVVDAKDDTSRCVVLNAIDYARARACVNYLEGINPEAVPIAFSLLRDFLKEYDFCDGDGSHVIGTNEANKIRELIALAEKK